MGKSVCKFCSKEFDSEESMNQHVSAKHSSSKDENSKIDKKKLKKYILLAILIIAVIIFSSTFYIRAQKPGRYDDFAKCLTEKDAIIYGNDFCHFTNNQLNLFGKSEKYLKYVKCVENQELCDSKGVKITPTWEINGKTYSGEQSFEKLSELTGCKI